MNYVLTTRNLCKSYGAAPALRDLNLQLPEGRIIGLLGPNGSGKTTLLKLAAGVLTPTRGSIQIDGMDIGPQTKAIVSYLPDRTYLQNGQTIAEQLRLFSDFYADFDAPRAQAMLSDLGIPVKARFGSLSKGTREKVQLVLVMSRRARLYLLDEPIGGVDPAAREYILRTIVTNYDPKATVLLSTHLITDVEPVLDGFVFLCNGQVVRSGEADATRAACGKSLDALFREVFQCFPAY